MGNDASKQEAAEREKRIAERQARREARMAARADRNRAPRQSLPVGSATRSSVSRASGSSRQQDGKEGRAHPSAAHQSLGASGGNASSNMAGHYATAAEKGMLTRLRDGYKKAALSHKLNGDTDAALQMIRIAKQLDLLIQAINENKPVDLRGLPAAAPNVVRKSSGAASARKPSSTAPVPLVQVTEAPASDPEMTDAAPSRKRVNPESYTMGSTDVRNELSAMRGSRSRDPSPSPSASSAVSANISPDDAARLFNAPPAANSVLEAMHQRIDKYRVTEESAKAEGNAAKARRLGRIVKQYESAIDAYKNKKDFDYESLPTPPGFPPIPFDLQVEPAPGRRARQRAPDPPPPSPQLSARSVKSEPAAPPVPSNYRPKTELNAKVDNMSQLQAALKQAALEHKRTGEVEEAIQFMKLAKGFDPIIEAVKCGLPIDESTIPQIPDEVMHKLQQLNL